MPWTKVTDALPPHLKPVMVSVTAGSAEKAALWHEFAWDENEKKWKVYAGGGVFHDAQICGTITHWMEYPKPRTLMEDWKDDLDKSNP